MFSSDSDLFHAVANTFKWFVFYSLWNKTATIAVTGTILLFILFKLSERSTGKRVEALNPGHLRKPGMMSPEKF